jgi:hypothetical protein
LGFFFFNCKGGRTRSFFFFPFFFFSIFWFQKFENWVAKLAKSSFWLIFPKYKILKCFQTDTNFYLFLIPKLFVTVRKFAPRKQEKKKKKKKPWSGSTGGPGELGTWRLRLAAASRTDLTDDPLRRNAAFASLVSLVRMPSVIARNKEGVVRQQRSQRNNNYSNHRNSKL